MTSPLRDYTLELLLDYDGYIHVLEEGYVMKFVFRRCQPSNARPGGIEYSLTLHDPDGNRILGFDNVHSVPTTRRGRHRMQSMSVRADHWHRDSEDPGRVYLFVDSATLLKRYCEETARVLEERGVTFSGFGDAIPYNKEKHK